jgi:hypothetical protein
MIRERIRNKNIRENLNALEDKLTSKGIKWHGHIFRVNEGKIPKKILNLKLKGK